MSDRTLRNKIIRLAHEHPELQDDLLPLIKKDANWGMGGMPIQDPQAYEIALAVVKRDHPREIGTDDVLQSLFHSRVQYKSLGWPKITGNPKKSGYDLTTYGTKSPVFFRLYFTAVWEYTAAVKITMTGPLRGTGTATWESWVDVSNKDAPGLFDHLK